MTEWNASEYHQLSALQDVMAAEVLSLLQLKGNERILDVGCGNGKTTASIAARVPKGSVVGVDASSDMVVFAKEHWTADHPNLQFAVADARHLPFKREFDFVVSFNALHWISDQALPSRSQTPVWERLSPKLLFRTPLRPEVTKQVYQTSRHRFSGAAM